MTYGLKASSCDSLIDFQLKTDPIQNMPLLK